MKIREPWRRNTTYIRFTQGDTSCQLGEAENEDLTHLLMACPKYNDFRPDELKDINQQ